MSLRNALLGLVFSIVFVLPTTASENVSAADYTHTLAPESNIVIIISGITEGNVEVTIQGDTNEQVLFQIIDESGSAVFSRATRVGDSLEIPQELMNGNYRMVVSKKKAVQIKQL